MVPCKGRQTFSYLSTETLVIVYSQIILYLTNTIYQYLSEIKREKNTEFSVFDDQLKGTAVNWECPSK